MSEPQIISLCELQKIERKKKIKIVKNMLAESRTVKSEFAKVNEFLESFSSPQTNNLSSSASNDSDLV